MGAERFNQQIAFIIEIDRLKSVIRRSYLVSGERHENSAEHSWHLALMALTLAEYAAAPVDVSRVIRLVLVHDLVEIDAGDTYTYDPQGRLDQAAREQQAADRLFALLPADQSAALRALWDEFEAGATPEARFAVALDTLMPLLHNYHTQGRSWQEHGVDAAQVRQRMQRIRAGSEQLWQYAEGLIAAAVSAGYLRAASDQA